VREPHWRQPMFGEKGIGDGWSFALLQNRAARNAQRAVDVYTAELPDFRAMATRTPVRSAMLDFAVLLRRREAELAEDGAPSPPYH
jgi:hypothetical protein